MTSKELERLVKMAKLGEAVECLVNGTAVKRGRPAGAKAASNGAAKPKRKYTRRVKPGVLAPTSEAALADHVDE